MRILISTIVYKPLELEQFWPLYDAVNDPEIGIEVFPSFHLSYFETQLQQHLPRLREHYISFHAPYWHTDPCYPQDSPEYQVHLKYFEQTFQYAQELKAGYMVIHPYNLHFAACEREEKIARFKENLPELREMAAKYGCRLALENVEILGSPDDYMFTQEQFIELADELDIPILIDIGHANCGGWDLSEVIRRLKDRIVGYHVHNNDGSVDSHERLLDGTIDIDRFIADVKKYTPDADLTVEYAPRLGGDISGICDDIAYMKAKFSE